MLKMLLKNAYKVSCPLKMKFVFALKSGIATPFRFHWLKILEPFGLDSFRLFLSGHNLLIIFDDVKINDPESVSSTGWFYPQQTLLSAGFSLSF